MDRIWELSWVVILLLYFGQKKKKSCYYRFTFNRIIWFTKLQDRTFSNKYISFNKLNLFRHYHDLWYSLTKLNKYFVILIIFNIPYGPVNILVKTRPLFIYFFTVTYYFFFIKTVTYYHHQCFLQLDTEERLRNSGPLRTHRRLRRLLLHH